LHSEDIREAMTPHDTKKMSGNEIREMFLRFFESKGHRRVRSSSLVPHGDPTLLFTNAGMNQFKDVFLGLEKRDYNKATTAQKCVRAGGKHNDLENVGFTKRHHTFFEMMGNFSFGDYFKEKAIPYAWELVTSPDWFGLAREKLYVTVFGGAEVAPGTNLGVDEEAREFWLKENVPAERIVPIPGLKDNFWAMGDTGPCGPCSEIFYDMGVEASEEGHVGDKECKFPCDCGRYVEIWNLVFMQFNRDASGALTPLPKPCVDTGMGLERTAAVLQNVISNYDTDLFVPLLKRAAELCGVEFRREQHLEEGKGGAASLRVIADHARATTFLINDGVIPSNEGRGYVLRKIIRRAIRHGHLLGMDRPFLSQMVDAVSDLMKEAYPDLGESQIRVSQTVLSEEKQFARTIQLASEKLDELIGSTKSEERKRCIDSFIRDSGNDWDRRGVEQVVDAFLPERALDPRRVSGDVVVLSDSDLKIRRYFQEHFHPRLSGSKAFNLYETYGLPQDFIADACHDAGVNVDWPGFERAMEDQRRFARASWKGGSKETASPAYARIAETFKTEKGFYSATKTKDARIEAIIATPVLGSAPSGPVNELKAGQSGEIVLDRTVIYAESGGQATDTGKLYDNSESQLLAHITDAYYPVSGLIAHKVLAEETLRVGDRVTVVANAERHARIIRNHSGTHLVHAALRNILGTHVKQAGSLNAPERLRFDFSHFAHVDAEELKDIEQQVNDEIRHNTEIGTEITSLDNALASGALAFFGDKYPEANVRVVTIPDERAPRGFYSKELCGGTHVHRIGDIGVLKIVSEGSVAAGVRRIEAVTGIGALEHYEKQAQILAQVASKLNTSEDSVLATVEKLSTTVKQLEKELEGQKRKGALGQLDQLAAQVQTINGVKLIAAEVSGVDKETLRQLVDSLRQKLGSGVVVLGTIHEEKVALIAGVTKDLTAKVHAGKLIQALSKLVGGSGGGRPDLAEAGGKDTAALKSALSTIPALLEPLL
jgi:alanyl-tRNA synthetase